MTDADLHFSRQILPHSRSVYATALRLLRRADEAEDVVQDIMARLWQMRHGLPPDDALAPLIATMTRRLCIDRLRTRHTALIDDIGSGPDADSAGPDAASAAAADTTVDDRDRLAHVAGLIRRLPADQQRALRLRVVDDLSTAQIAQLMGLRDDHVRQLLSRARRRLRDMALQQHIL